MKQGRATSDRLGSTKTEPISHGVDPGYTAQLGNHVGNANAVEPMYEGRGLKAPMVGETSHKAGSQGRHK